MARLFDFLRGRAGRSRYTMMMNPFGMRGPQWNDWSPDKAVKEGYKASAWVFRSVGLRANAVASVPWFVEVKRGDAWERKPDHPLQILIDEPNPKMSFSTLLRYMIAHLDLAGNAYWLKVRQGEGVVLELWPLMPQSVTPIAGGDELITGYRVSNWPKPLLPLDIAQVSYINPSNFTIGQSPLQAAAKAVDVDNAAAAWQKISLQNRGVPDGVFMTEGEMTEGQFEEARRQIREQYANQDNARTPWVLGGAKWEQMSLSPVEMDYLNTRNMTREEIGVVYGTAEMLASLASANRASAETVRKSFWLDTIVPLLDEIKPALNLTLAREFGNSREIRIVYDTSGVDALQTNEQDLLKLVEGYWRMGVPFNVLNARFGLGFEDIEGGDTGYIPAGLLPADLDWLPGLDTPTDSDAAKSLAQLAYGVKK